MTRLQRLITEVRGAPSKFAGKRALDLVKRGEWNIILSKTGRREWTGMVTNPEGGGGTEKGKTEDGLMWLLQRRTDLRGAEKVWIIRATFGNLDGKVDHWATDAFWYHPDKPWPIR